MFARLANWKEILDTAHLSADRQMDPVSKWLIITRATVFSMTLTSGLIGAMLAIQSAPALVNYGYLALAVFGIVIAHAANNIINDYFDLEVGIDTNDYVRAQYMPHPILRPRDPGLPGRRPWVAGRGLRPPRLPWLAG